MLFLGASGIDKSETAVIYYTEWGCLYLCLFLGFCVLLTFTIFGVYLPIELDFDVNIHTPND